MPNAPEIRHSPPDRFCAGRQGHRVCFHPNVAIFEDRFLSKWSQVVSDASSARKLVTSDGLFPNSLSRVEFRANLQHFSAQLAGRRYSTLGCFSWSSPPQADASICQHSTNRNYIGEVMDANYTFSSVTVSVLITVSEFFLAILF